MKYVKTCSSEGRRRFIRTEQHASYSGLAVSTSTVKALNKGQVTLHILGRDMVISLKDYMQREEALKIYLKV